MQLPAAGDVAVGADVTAAGAGAQSAPDAAQTNSARAGLDIHIARAGKFGLNVAAPGVAVERGRDILRPNPAASCLDMSSAAEIAQPDVARTSLCLHFSANALDADTAGTAVRLHGSVRWHRHLIADGGVPLHIFGEVVANADIVPVLLNRRIGLELVDRVFGVAEPVVAMNGAMHSHLVCTASLDGDLARASGEIEIDNSGNRERTVEMPFNAGMQQDRDQQKAQERGYIVPFHKASQGYGMSAFARTGCRWRQPEKGENHATAAEQ